MLAEGRSFARAHLGVVLVTAVLALLITAAGVTRARPITVSAATPGPVGTPAASTGTSASGTGTLAVPFPSVSATGSSNPSAQAGPDRSRPTIPASRSGTGPATVGTSSSGASGSTLVVHVIGAVRRPGLVRLPPTARVADALSAARGLTAAAAPGELNLAQPLADGQQVVIVTKAAVRAHPLLHSEVRDPSSTAGTATVAPTPGRGGGAGPGAKVNLNTATAQQLDSLSGVGPVTAQRILDWRAEHGRFSRIDELQEVQGIGPKTFAELAGQVTV